ncbi:MAG: hypothetical protein SWK90_18285 [Chloroflexota bacterium]|nr:hypothetical protein [Chloroflexota bacterium]
MIDVWGVLANGFWILGLAVLLAVLSWAHWTASVEKVRFRAVLGRPKVQRVLNLGLAFFCAGLAATGRSWWERVIWGLLAAVWAVQAWMADRRAESGDKEYDTR